MRVLAPGHRGHAAPGPACGRPRPRPVPVPRLLAERPADLDELDVGIAERDVPPPLEVEVVAEDRRLLADVQGDDAAVGGFDEGVDALLARDAGVEVTRRLE